MLANIYLQKAISRMRYVYNPTRDCINDPLALYIHYRTLNFSNLNRIE